MNPVTQIKYIGKNILNILIKLIVGGLILTIIGISLSFSEKYLNKKFTREYKCAKKSQFRSISPQIRIKGKYYHPNYYLFYQ